MKTTTFKLIDAINREGIDNSVWGVCSDIEDTKNFFGAKESIELQGQHIYIYRYPDTYFAFIKEDVCGRPVHTLTIEDGFIDIYKL